MMIQNKEPRLFIRFPWRTEEEEEEDDGRRGGGRKEEIAGGSWTGGVSVTLHVGRSGSVVLDEGVALIG